jgi:hypothetical protein
MLGLSHSRLFILATMMVCLLDVVSKSIHFLNYVAKPVQTVCIHVPLLHSHFKRGRFTRDMYEYKLLWVSLSPEGEFLVFSSTFKKSLPLNPNVAILESFVKFQM